MIPLPPCFRKSYPVSCVVVVVWTGRLDHPRLLLDRCINVCGWHDIDLAWVKYRHSIATATALSWSTVLSFHWFPSKPEMPAESDCTTWWSCVFEVFLCEAACYTDCWRLCIQGGTKTCRWLPRVEKDARYFAR